MGPEHFMRRQRRQGQDEHEVCAKVKLYGFLFALGVVIFVCARSLLDLTANSDPYFLSVT